MLKVIRRRIKKLYIIIYIYAKFLNLHNQISNRKIWRKAFVNYFMEEQYGCKLDKKQAIINKKLLLNGFISRKIKLVKSTEKYLLHRDDLILICVVKNELQEMPIFFSHYRKLGIKRFVFIDNMSTDGTLQYLLDQEDTEVYRVNEEFCSFMKEGWINRILSMYGFNQWYLVVDADELIVWPRIKEISLKNMLNVFRKKRMRRPLAMMLDMYSNGLLYNFSGEDIFKEYCYCDKDSYYWQENQRVNIMIGGPRERAFKIKVWLSKTPLFYFKPLEIFCCAHYMYPYQKYNDAKCPIVLLHYKFAFKENYNEMREYTRRGKDEIRIAESNVYIRKRGFKLFYKNSMCLDKLEKLLELQYVYDITRDDCLHLK